METKVHMKVNIIMEKAPTKALLGAFSVITNLRVDL